MPACISFIAITLWQLVSSQSNYVLNLTASGVTFFDHFEFLQDQQCVENSYTDFIMNLTDAKSKGYISTTNGSVYIGSDYTNVLSNNAKGRTGICIGTKQRYNNGLFILDANHMPFGCSVWPSWWMTDGTWEPNVCEIDTIEGINLFNDDQTTLHTHQSCDFASQKANINITGKWDNTNCNDDKDGGSGCTIEPNVPQSYGQGFNNIKGGVYAQENNANTKNIRFWFWTRDNIPSDIKNKKPNPNGWGLPFAEYTSGSWCPDTIFNTAKQVRLDIYFCGWAGGDPTWRSQCNGISKGKSCEEFVAQNPSYFSNAFWSINYMDVYQLTN